MSLYDFISVCIARIMLFTLKLDHNNLVNSNAIHKRLLFKSGPIRNNEESSFFPNSLTVSGGHGQNPELSFMKH